MVMRVLVRVFLFVRMRMWVFVCILTVMRVRMDMVVVMFLLCIPIVHAHHRLSDFYILLFFVPCRKPPRGMKFCARHRNQNPLRG